MARGDSIIRVSIIGDAKKLLGTLGEVDRKTGGLLKIAGGAFLASRVIDTGFDIIGESVDKADAFADSLDRISRTVSPDFAKRIEDVAFDMTDIGLSADEVGTMAAAFAALATAAKVTEPTIAAVTPDLLRIASAIAASTGKTVDEVIEDIGKAIKGSQRPVEEYGFVIDAALSPDQTILSILEQAKILFPEVKSATDDLAGSQDNLGAKWDNFTILLGNALEGPLKGVVDWGIDILEMIPSAIQGWQMLGKSIEDFGRFALGPLGNVRDAINAIGDAINNVGNLLGANGTPARNLGSFEDDVIAAQNRVLYRNGLAGHLGR
jgi:hypothetical protein